MLPDGRPGRPRAHKLHQPARWEPMKIFISPSDQTGNPYSYGGTNPARHMVTQPPGGPAALTAP